MSKHNITSPYGSKVKINTIFKKAFLGIVLLINIQCDNDNNNPTDKRETLTTSSPSGAEQLPQPDPAKANTTQNKPVDNNQILNVKGNDPKNTHDSSQKSINIQNKPSYQPSTSAQHPPSNNKTNLDKKTESHNSKSNTPAQGHHSKTPNADSLTLDEIVDKLIDKINKKTENCKEIDPEELITILNEFKVKADQAINSNKHQYDQDKLKQILEIKLTDAVSRIKGRCSVNKQSDQIDKILGKFFVTAVEKYARQIDDGATDEQISLNIHKCLEDAKTEIQKKQSGRHTADELRKILKECFLKEQNNFDRKKEHIRNSEKAHRRAGLWATWTTVAFIIIPMTVLP